MRAALSLKSPQTKKMVPRQQYLEWLSSVLHTGPWEASQVEQEWPVLVLSTVLSHWMRVAQGKYGLG